MQGPGGIRGPGAVPRGGNIDVEVDGGGSVSVTIPGQAPTKTSVQGGKASIPVPANIPAGTRIQITVLGRVPPEGIEVEVIDNN